MAVRTPKNFNFFCMQVTGSQHEIRVAFLERDNASICQCSTLYLVKFMLMRQHVNSDVSRDSPTDRGGLGHFGYRSPKMLQQLVCIANFVEHLRAGY